MSKFTFELFTTITSEIEIEADSYQEAFIKFENQFYDGENFENKESIIREYILLDSCRDDFEEMLAGCPEDSLSLHKKEYATMTLGIRDVAKLDKHRGGFLTSSQIVREQVKLHSDARNAGNDEAAKAIWNFGNHLNRIA